jgi:hypothetical protein
MNDRELLELAAKAAGIDAIWFDELAAFVANDTPNAEWDPLNDDGDALRLAVTLGMNLELNDVGEGVHAETRLSYLRELAKSDPYAASRRVIVRAAAEIGRAMK